MTNKEKLLEETYDKFVQTSLMDLPLDGIEQFIDPAIMGYGSANDEKILSISDYRELIIRQREQGKDIEMTIDIVPVLHRITGNGNSALFIDEVTIKMIINNETHQLFMRLSSVLEYREEKWFALHFHGSLPGEAEGATDTWHINEWQKKNEDLQRLVEEKTIDLIQKNHELEIEAALEKVRAVTMGMRKPDDMLNICKIISTQLQALGVEEIRNVQTAIIYKSKGTYLNYEYYRLHDKQLITEVDYQTHPTEKEFANQMLKSKDAFFNTRFEGTELKKWMEHQKNASQFVDSYLYKAQAVNYYFFSLGPVALGISTYSPLPENNLQIFKRFRNVFGLAYRRFIDIEQALAQAREAQIEASLERVRAQAMSMMKSDELIKVCESVFNELRLLGFNETDLRNTQIVINNDEKEIYHGYQYSDYIGGEITEVPYDLHSVIRMLHNKLKQSTAAFADIEISGAALEDWKSFVKSFPQKLDEKLNAATELHYYFYSVGIGALGISSFKTISVEKLQILQRLRNVFHLSYQRYQDIAQAEAQAREAQIELALEKVRARTMAMQKSNELAGTVSVIFKQLLNLGVKPAQIRTCGIVTFSENEPKGEIWITDIDGEIIENSFIAPFNEAPAYKTVYSKWKEGEKFIVLNLKDKQFFEHLNYVKKYSNVPNIKIEEIKKLYQEIYFYVLYFSQGYLFIITYEPLHTYLEVFKRFGATFQQSYTRFLDLQKAEAQAWEAQIEAALERVRSRAMAMHKSDDLTSSVAVVFSELNRIGFHSIRCGIGIFNDRSRKVNVWTASTDHETAHLSGDEVLEGHPLLEKIYDAWRNQIDCSYTLKGKELIDYYAYTAKSNLPVRAPEVLADGTTQYYHGIMFPAGGLFAFRDNEFSQEDISLMKRFSDVFNLAFTRHLDLKHAEAQNTIIQAENDRKSKELEEARELQMSMLPKEVPQQDHLDIAVYMQTATEVGGDYYDFKLGEDGTLTAVIGDATGHGLKAGTVVTITKSLFHSLASGKDILSSFAEISRVIKGMKFRQLSMCLQMLKIKENKLVMSSAAMPPVLIYRKNKKTVEEVEISGMPLGAMNNFPYKLRETKLNKGDTIFMMSDGYPELMNKNKGMFGYQRVKNKFRSIADKSPKEMIHSLKKSASQWASGKDPDDDVTFVVIKVK